MVYTLRVIHGKDLDLDANEHVLHLLWSYVTTGRVRVSAGSGDRRHTVTVNHIRYTGAHTKCMVLVCIPRTPKGEDLSSFRSRIIQPPFLS
jgi:hypothetical protein